MSTKLVKITKKYARPNETGEKHIKNVNPNHNQMILYRTPKKINIGRFFKKTFTWDIEVWVAKCFWPKPNGFASTDSGIPRRDKSLWVYGVVKERHLNTWALNNGIFYYSNADCVKIDNIMPDYNRKIDKLNVYVPDQPDWVSRGGLGGNFDSNNIFFTLPETPGDILKSIYKDYNTK